MQMKPLLKLKEQEPSTQTFSSLDILFSSFNLETYLHLQRFSIQIIFILGSLLLYLWQTHATWKIAAHSANAIAAFIFPSFVKLRLLFISQDNDSS